jgi:FtsP/CotA-like multicopper oxidase with cupredoxin domain
MKKTLLLAPFLLLLSFAVHAAYIPKTLYINKGGFVAVDTTTFPAYAFNATATYDARNETVTLQSGDQLVVTVVNTDTVQHGFSVKGMSGASFFIPASGTVTDTISFPSAGVFIFHDHQGYPNYSYLGAAGMISVEADAPDARYFWNLHEFERSWNDSLDSGQAVSWVNFNPDYFTVNGLSYPRIDVDSTAKVRGAVGDTIHICIANTGRSVHSVHFHGYHLRVVHSSKHPVEVDWSRDTQPIWPMETLLLELVPDKPGIFPVHDHNLMAQTGNRYYNHGIMLYMQIQ